MKHLIWFFVLALILSCSTSSQNEVDHHNKEREAELIGELKDIQHKVDDMIQRPDRSQSRVRLTEEEAEQYFAKRKANFEELQAELYLLAEEAEKNKWSREKWNQRKDELSAKLLTQGFTEKERLKHEEFELRSSERRALAREAGEKIKELSKVSPELSGEEILEAMKN